MSTGNPSHLLISRNPRSPAHPQLASTTTSLYSPQPGPSPHLFSFDHSPEPSHARSLSTPLFPIDAEDAEEDEDDIVVHPTFCRDAALPGRVKVIVGRYEFWCHKEVLWFASPFFNALLQGSWAETNKASPTDTTDTDPNHPRETEREQDVKDEKEDVKAEANEPLPALQTVLESEAKSLATPVTPISPRSSRSARSARRSRQSLGIEDDRSENKSSVYLDAVDGFDNGPGPSVAEILRELRDIPEPVGAALDAIEGSRGRTDAIAQPTPTAAHPHVLPFSAAPRTPPSQASPVVPPERPRSAPAPSPSEVLPPPQPTSLSPPLPMRLQPVLPSACPPTVTAASARRNTRDPRSETHFDPNIPAWPGRTAASPAAAEKERPDATVELHEESPGAFQDFLFWAYPHLECKVTWTNVEGLLALSSKLIVPALQSLCERFLMTHASGRPIIALYLAEQHGNAELYREASRFVLDQATWDISELDYLSEQTQLKLSQRRTWFLERLLKLGSIDPKKEYTCRSDCPDPSRCQAQLDEKWRQAHQAVSRYGPPQPSVAFRCLRQLETFPTNPSLVMPHPLCQTAAKSWVMTLFDRMFQPKMAFGALSPGTEKYWLYITLG